MEKIYIQNLDIDLMKDKLNNLDDIGDRINLLLGKLSVEKLHELKPKEFYTMSSKQHNEYNQIKYSPYKTSVKQDMLVKSRLSIEDNNIYSINLSFSDEAMELIDKIKKLRDQIEFADSNPELDLSEEDVPIVTSNELEVDDKTFLLENNILVNLPNGENISLDSGSYSIIDTYYENGILKAVCILKGQHKIWLYLGEGKNVTSIKIEGQSKYNLNQDIEYQLPDGKKITLKKGEYDVIETITDNRGNVIRITIMVNNQKMTFNVQNGHIIGGVAVTISNRPLADIVLPDVISSESLSIENNSFTLNKSLNYHFEDGSIFTLASNTYQVLEAIYDAKGNCLKIVILANGYRITLEIVNNQVSRILDVTKETVVLQKSDIKNANNIKAVDWSLMDYRVIKYLYDASLNAISVVIEVNGEIRTFPIYYNNVVGLDNVVTTYTLLQSETIILPNNSQLVLEAKNYQVIDALYDVSGVIKAVCILKDNYKIWLYLNSEGKVINIEYIDIKNGVFWVNNQTYPILDNYQNKTDETNSGQYYIYEVKHNIKGQIEEINISKNFEEEKWIDIKNENNYALFNEVINYDNQKALALFEKNKALFGVLGILFVGLGVALVVRKKQKGNHQNEYFDELHEGNYAVYDVKENNGNIIEAKINPDDSEEEYWVEL